MFEFRGSYKSKLNIACIYISHTKIKLIFLFNDRCHLFLDNIYSEFELLGALLLSRGIICPIRSRPVETSRLLHIMVVLFCLRDPVEQLFISQVFNLELFHVRLNCEYRSSTIFTHSMFGTNE